LSREEEVTKEKEKEEGQGSGDGEKGEKVGVEAGQGTTMQSQALLFGGDTIYIVPRLVPFFCTPFHDTFLFERTRSEKQCLIPLILRRNEVLEESQTIRRIIKQARKDPPVGRSVAWTRSIV